jgi:DNA-binding transcriptional ArsR family regulator
MNWLVYTYRKSWRTLQWRYKHWEIQRAGRYSKRLARRPLAVIDLANALPVSRPAVSQHLRVLKDAGLVIVRQEGTRHVYQVDPQGVEMMRQYLDRMWARALASFKVFAEGKNQ